MLTRRLHDAHWERLGEWHALSDGFEVFVGDDGIIGKGPAMYVGKTLAQIGEAAAPVVAEHKAPSSDWYEYRRRAWAMRDVARADNLATEAAAHGKLPEIGVIEGEIAPWDMIVPAPPRYPGDTSVYSPALPDAKGEYPLGRRLQGTALNEPGDPNQVAMFFFIPGAATLEQLARYEGMMIQACDHAQLHYGAIARVVSGKLVKTTGQLYWVRGDYRGLNLLATALSPELVLAFGIDHTHTLMMTNKTPGGTVILHGEPREHMRVVVPFKAGTPKNTVGEPGLSQERMDKILETMSGSLGRFVWQHPDFNGIHIAVTTTPEIVTTLYPKVRALGAPVDERELAESAASLGKAIVHHGDLASIGATRFIPTEINLERYAVKEDADGVGHPKRQPDPDRIARIHFKREEGAPVKKPLLVEVERERHGGRFLVGWGLDADGNWAAHYNKDGALVSHRHMIDHDIIAKVEPVKRVTDRHYGTTQWVERKDADKPSSEESKPKKQLTEAEKNKMAGLPPWWIPPDKRQITPCTRCHDDAKCDEHAMRGDAWRTDPPVSEKQRRAMWAAASGNSRLGIPKSVGEEFVKGDSATNPPGGDLDDYEVAEGVRDGDFPSPTRYGDFWLFDIRITGTGAAYREKLGEWSIRDPKLWTSDAFLKRCNGLPVIFEHPDTAGLNEKEWRNRAIGTVMIPYVKDDEVWGIAKIFDQDAAELMQTTHISTSPGVIPPKEAKPIHLEEGGQVLAEPLPLVLDHIAICEAGVWDKDGPPEGIRLDAQPRKDRTSMAETEAEKKLREERDDARSKFDGLKKRVDALEGKMRRDEHEGEGEGEEGEEGVDKEPRGDKGGRKDDDDDRKRKDAAFEGKETKEEEEEEEEEDRGDKKRAKKDGGDDDDDDDDRKDDDDDGKRKDRKDDDDDDKRRRKDRKDDDDKKRGRRDGAPTENIDADRGTKIDGKPMPKSRHDSHDSKDGDETSALRAEIRRLSARLDTAMTVPSMEDRDALATAFMRADSIYQMHGDQTPPQMPGESPIAYRHRLANGLRKHTKDWKDYPLHDSIDKRAFELIEKQIYDQAMEQATAVTSDQPGVLREVKTMEMGKQVSRFYGDSKLAWLPFMTPQRMLLRKIDTGVGRAS